MDHLGLAVISVLFVASLLRQAHGCFSEHDCCNHSRIHNLGRSFRVQYPGSTSPYTTDSATDCQATSTGAVSQRSISPWSYKKDFSATRYPQNLWQASCSCDNCLSFNSTPQQNVMTYNKLELKGNSVTVRSGILVFYRKHCPDQPGLFYLQPSNYMINVACACVVPRLESLIFDVRWDDPVVWHESNTAREQISQTSLYRSNFAPKCPHFDYKSWSKASGCE
ncbi:interleukin-25 [Pantherophis guttatus]|uniref:Interleukin-25 n=1 Tax=Pantherophis guttatus TaxID=94885 RepID=A0A6P9AU87_PANGU|nr:interleukin-25 [Pantherophis guttatus]